MTTKQREEEKNETLNKLVEVFNEGNLTEQETVEIISNFLYSIGASMSSDKIPESIEDVSRAYLSNPSLSSALMAQAVHMKKTWIDETNERKDEK